MFSMQEPAGLCFNLRSRIRAGFIERSTRISGLRTLLWLFVLVTGCITPTETPSTQWPPADFYLEVRVTDGKGDRVRVRFWADGLVLYGESDRQITGADDGPLRLPVFHVLSAYEMLPESIRSLTRLLDRAGLRALATDQVGALEAEAELVTLTWQGFGATPRSVFAKPPLQGGIVPVLHILNAFLPEGRQIEVAGLGGDPEPRHLVEVPSPVDSMEGGLGLYVESLLERYPRDANLLIEAFSLAVASGQRDVASDLLDRLAGMDVLPNDPLWIDPDRSRAQIAENLRGLVGGHAVERGS